MSSSNQVHVHWNSLCSCTINKIYQGTSLQEIWCNIYLHEYSLNLIFLIPLKIKIIITVSYFSLDHESRLLDLPSHRLEELFIEFWTLEGTVTTRGPAITIWRLKPLTNQIISTMGAAITIWLFIANDQSNHLPKFWVKFFC